MFPPQQQPQQQPPGSPQGAPAPAQLPPGPQDQQGQQPPVTIDAVMELLSNDRMRGFRIDVETDSLVEADQDADKKRRIEFVTSVAEYIAKTGPVAQQMPALAPMIGEMLKFAVRGFKVGQEIEDAIDKGMDAAGMALKNPPPPQPSPDELIKLEGIKAKTQAEIQKAQIDAQTAQADAQMKMQTMALQHQQAQADHEHKMAEHQMKMQAMQAQQGIDQQAQQFQQAQQAQDFVQQQAERVAPENGGA
jgi:hypothetical protein